MTQPVENYNKNDIRGGSLFRLNNGGKGGFWFALNAHTSIKLRALLDRRILEMARARGNEHGFINREIHNAKVHLSNLEKMAEMWDESPWPLPEKQKGSWVRMRMVVQQGCNDRNPDQIGYSYFDHECSRIIREEMPDEDARDQSQQPPKPDLADWPQLPPSNPITAPEEEPVIPEKEKPAVQVEAPAQEVLPLAPEPQPQPEQEGGITDKELFEQMQQMQRNNDALAKKLGDMADTLAKLVS